ncbi:MAG TPA: CBS domain-containing protein [Nitrospirota bacterium]|nr:CBS domain-containing protein [Nitrospirota bacterium]
MYASITVGQVLRAKGHGFHAVGPEATAYDALEIMAEKNVGALLVIEGGNLAGVFSERDYARKVILKGKSSKNTKVRELMSSPPITVGSQTSLRDCMVLMTENHIRHLPVINDGVLMGVMSIGDVVNAIISEQTTAIKELENYIAGNEYTCEAVTT